MAENKFFGCTDPAQAKALIKAGLDPDSFDMLYGYVYNGETYAVPNIRPFRDMRDRTPDGYSPCWSLARLISLMPPIGSYVPTLIFDGDEYACQYMDEDGIGSPDLQCFSADEPVVAVASMILHLLEKDYIHRNLVIPDSIKKSMSL